MMLRTFGAFLLVFALLSLVVHLRGTCMVFGTMGMALCGVDYALARLSRDSRVNKMRRQLVP
jgi:hypothetical protein